MAVGLSAAASLTNQRVGLFLGTSHVPEAVGRGGRLRT